ncbi:MAG: M23 family metallopeptidase [Candidatus Peregrinibacteria bacterium]|nr:M23 family metallopeptidase [Candidatus Peregrinibacteria bacterium]
MTLVSRKRMGFSVASVQQRTEPTPMYYISQRVTFWIAVLSVFAFVTGNMVGQHGWHVFWKSVLGEFDDSLIVYDGTVSPVRLVPDYRQWSLYGGDATANTYRQVPKDLLIELPKYTLDEQMLDYDHAPDGDVYSIGNLGSYATGADGEGSHPGVDLRVPEGTPVLSVMNGIVTRVGEDKGGYGKFIVVRHPRVPDPSDQTTVTTLHSAYAHLSSTFVTEGTVVRKGEEIGLSGATGLVSGPHLHFQIDRDSAPWHPYWPFTGSEAREAGFSFTEAINRGLHQERGREHTVHAMLYVQANYTPVSGAQILAQASSSSRKFTIADRVAQRMQLRSVKRVSMVALAEPSPVIPLHTAPVTQSSASSQSIVVQTETVVSLADQPLPKLTGETVEIYHDGEFSGRGWEKIEVRIVGPDGKPVREPVLDADFFLRTGYGKAEFRPEKLTRLDFANGIAQVEMLPHGRTTIVVVVQPFGVLSGPMRYVAE